MASKDSQNSGASGKAFPIVGIGASAGGLEALQRFLDVLPKKFDFAMVFVQHLSAKFKSILAELLSAKIPSLVIQEISAGLKVQPGRLYLAPPGKEVRLRNGHFQTTVHPEGLIHLPIDEFLASLAEDAAERSIAVIFSGAGTDGARGIRAIRDAGGTVYVQDPATSEFNSMPLAAIATGQADAVLSPEDICRELLKIQGIGAAAVSRDPVIAPEEFEGFFRVLLDKTGARFNHYKKSVVGRRIRRRMYLYGVSTVKDYLDMLSSRDAEAASLASDLMIGVTSFFRDRVAWKALNIEVVKKLAAENSNLPVRVWTPASATGEEAYSITMMLSYEFARAGRTREIQVFATDVNDRALEKAREGKYPASIAADVPREYIQKYFTPLEDGQVLVVTKEIRERVVVARQDLLTDPPFSKLDLIICRNFMIYLEPEAQEKCIALFHYALKDGGYLFLGNAETTGRKNSHFMSVGRKQCRVYRKVGAQPAARLPLSVPYAAERASQPLVPRVAAAGHQSLIGFAQEFLLEEFAPAAVAIDQNYDIVYHNGPTHRYLRQPRGIPTRNLLELLPDALRNRIRGAVYRAGQEGRPVSIRANVSGDDDRRRPVTLRISRIKENLFIVVFREKGGPAKKEEAKPLDAGRVEETAIHQLESELSATRQDLQSHIEQLKSLNEELQSSNEELQAANEELETSREELQSLNEELVTVNSQLQTKIEEQDETNNDLNNFLASTNIPTMFLDLQFRVRRYTPAMLKLIKLLPSDVGRPIVDMSQENLGQALIADAESVLESLVPLKQEIPISGTWYVRSTLPYRTADSRIAGVVITYNDVTDLKTAEERTRHLASFPRLNPNPVIEVDSFGKIIFSNPAAKMFLESTGMDREEVAVFLPEDLGVILQDLEKDSPSSVLRDVTIGDRVFSETVQLIPQFNVVRIYAYDITKRKRAEEALRESELRVRRKLESVLSPEGDIGKLELGDIMDPPALQALVDNLYEFVRLPIGILDLKGRVLVGVGWQDICTKFHRIHPDTCRHCTESDLELTRGVSPGEFKLYKCKNGMWDAVTPLMVGGQHMGNIFWGQFFFEDETVDREFFRTQARAYGFDEEEYLAVLDKVPRISRKALDTGMAFYLKLADMLSKLSYSNIKLAQTLSVRDALLNSLGDSEERLKRAQEISHLGSWELNLVNGTLAWSDEVYRIFGLEPQEFSATYEAFLEAVHPDDRVAVNEAYSGSIREGKDTYEIEHRVVRKSSGEIRHVHEKCQHFRDDAGKIIRSVGMVHDITERRRAEDALRESESRYHSLFENMTEGFAYCKMLFDAGDQPVDFVYLEVNHAFERLTGLKNVEGKKVTEVIPGIRETDPELFKIYGRVALMCESERLEFYLEALKEWFSLSIYCPQKEYFVAVFDVITERKRAEEALQRSLRRFELLALTASELLQASDPQKAVESICKRVMEYLDCHAFLNFLVDEEAGKLRLNACAGIPVEEAKRIEWLDFGVAVCGCVARDGERIVAEHIRTTPDERTDLVKSYGIQAYCCHPLLGPGGKTIGTLSFGTCGRETFSEDDLSLMKAVTDQVAAAMTRKAVEDEILKLSETMAARNLELESLNKELEAFNYSISHDLRAPIRSMAGFSKIVAEDYAEKLDEQGKDYLTRIQSASDKMTRLVDDLLNLSRISRQPIDRMDIDLGKLAESVVHNLREAYAGRSVEIVVHEGMRASVDPNLMRVVLTNLLDNAWKFTAMTEKARVEFGFLEEEGDTVYFVKDNGAGFDQEHDYKMFWPFHRLHTEKEFPGTGIGLAIVERIIRRHGGKVWAEGEVEKGATVYFTLG